MGGHWASHCIIDAPLHWGPLTCILCVTSLTALTHFLQYPSESFTHETEDEDKLNELAARINVEYSKTDDIYSMIEKDLLQKMHKDHQVNEDYINLMKYIRKNLKIIDRLEDIVSRLIFARMGGKL